MKKFVFILIGLSVFVSVKSYAGKPIEVNTTPDIELPQPPKTKKKKKCSYSSGTHSCGSEKNEMDPEISALIAS